MPSHGSDVGVPSHEPSYGILSNQARSGGLLDSNSTLDMARTITQNDLMAKALDVDAANLVLGHQPFQAQGAKFVRNRDVPDIYDANYVTDITASTPQEIDRLLARVEKEFEGYGHRRFDVDHRTPPAFVARLALEGYERSDALFMLLEGELSGAARQHGIRPVTTEADWQDLAALHEIDWKEYHERRNRPNKPEVARQMMRSKRLKQPPVQYWMAHVEGKPAAYLNSWAGIDGTGQIEDLFTHPDFRHRGLANALIQRCVADCRAKGAGLVLIVTDPTDTPKQMYAALGFRPIAVSSHYLKKLKHG